MYFPPVSHAQLTEVRMYKTIPFHYHHLSKTNAALPFQANNVEASSIFMHDITAQRQAGNLRPSDRPIRHLRGAS